MSFESKRKGRASVVFSLAACIAVALLVSGCGILRCGGASLYGVAVNICG